MTDRINRKSRITQIMSTNENICNGSGCSVRAIKRITVNCGEFGKISLDLCKICARMFEEEVQQR